MVNYVHDLSMFFTYHCVRSYGFNFMLSALNYGFRIHCVVSGLGPYVTLTRGDTGGRKT
jgi:hypothetical protein